LACSATHTDIRFRLEIEQHTQINLKMKNMIKLPAIMLGLMLLLTGISQKVLAQDDGDISLQTFYDELSPYGTWIQDPQYGYVWRPDVDQDDFRPYYSNGHWVMTEYGNTWVSDYDWGWAPFHYGRWVTDRYNQWLWIPDTTWGPAWVNWRSGGGNYGWAPLGPSINVGFSIPSFWWVFVPQTNIYINRFPRYRSYRNHRYLSNTVIINNVYVHNRNTYYTGPRRDEIRRVTNRDVRVYNINRTDRPGRSRISNNTVNIYNPRPVRGSDNRNAAPRSAVQRDAIARNDRSNGIVNGRNNNRMERPGTDRNAVDRNAIDRNARPRSGNDQQGGQMRRPQDLSQQRNAQRTPEQIQQRAQQMQQRNAQRTPEQIQQRAQQMQQRNAQRTPEQIQQRAQEMQQRNAQRTPEQNQQREQQMQQRNAQRTQEQNQQREQQMQQRNAQRTQEQNQQREQQAQQRTQQQSQQREQQQRQQMNRPERQERVQAPQRSAETSNSGSSRPVGGRESRGGRG
jgi:hypothetical protein